MFLPTFQAMAKNGDQAIDKNYWEALIQEEGTTGKVTGTELSWWGPP